MHSISTTISHIIKELLGGPQEVMGMPSRMLGIGRACLVITDSKLKENCLHKAGRILGEGGESVSHRFRAKHGQRTTHCVQI